VKYTPQPPKVHRKVLLPSVRNFRCGFSIKDFGRWTPCASQRTVSETEERRVSCDFNTVLLGAEKLMLAGGGIKSWKPCPRRFSISRGFPIPRRFPIPGAFPIPAEFSISGRIPMSGGFRIPGKFPIPGEFPRPRGFPVFLVERNPGEAHPFSKASELSETEGKGETVTREIICDRESNCD